MHPQPGHATEQDVLRLLDGDNKRLCELVDGVLVEKGIGQYESRIAVVLSHFLEDLSRRSQPWRYLWRRRHALRLMPRLVRIPDVTFVSWERLPGHELPSEPIPDLIPNLAVEVLSISNNKREIDRKIGEYFRSASNWYG